jgi:DNA-binding transcriptional LysR family regulator
LRELEKDLGAVLFKRGSRRLVLTDAGNAIYEHCERISSEVAAARHVVSDLQTEPSGEIRISLPYGFGTNWISGLIAKFAKAHPRVELLIQATQHSVDVSDEQTDVAFHVGRVGNQQLPAIKISELRRGVYASPAYCQERGIPQKPADLARHDCIPLESQRLAGLWTFGQGARAVRVRSRINVSDVSTAQQMAIAGLGFVILPNLICHEAVGSGQLQRVLTDWEIPPLVVNATFLERRHLPLRVRAFLDFIRREARPLARL